MLLKIYMILNMMELEEHGGLMDAARAAISEMNQVKTVQSGHEDLLAGVIVGVISLPPIIETLKSPLTLIHVVTWKVQIN